MEFGSSSSLLRGEGSFAWSWKLKIKIKTIDLRKPIVKKKLQTLKRLTHLNRALTGPEWLTQISDSCVAIRIIFLLSRRSDWDDISVKHVWCFKSSFPTFSSNKYLQPCYSLFFFFLRKKPANFIASGRCRCYAKKVRYKFYWIKSVIFSFFFVLFCNCVVVRHFL